MYFFYYVCFYVWLHAPYHKPLKIYIKQTIIIPQNLFAIEHTVNKPYKYIYYMETISHFGLWTKKKIQNTKKTMEKMYLVQIPNEHQAINPSQGIAVL